MPSRSPMICSTPPKRMPRAHQCLALVFVRLGFCALLCFKKCTHSLIMGNPPHAQLRSASMLMNSRRSSGFSGTSPPSAGSENAPVMQLTQAWNCKQLRTPEAVKYQQGLIDCASHGVIHAPRVHCLKLIACIFENCI